MPSCCALGQSNRNSKTWISVWWALSLPSRCWPLLPDDWIYCLIQSPLCGPHSHLWHKPLTPLHGTHHVHKWVSAQLGLPASPSIRLRGVSCCRGLRVCPFFEWHPYSHQRGRRRSRGRGLRDQGGQRRERNTTPLDMNFNLSSDLLLPGSDIKTQNHLPLTAGLAGSMGLISYT